MGTRHGRDFQRRSTPKETASDSSATAERRFDRVSAETNKPEGKDRSVSLAETTMQLDGLFDRRRDLMYQIGIVTAVASALLQVSNLGPNAQHLGTDSATVIAGFMAISTLVFCIRFVQLHADIMHHGMRFAFAEKSIHNDGFENAIANSRTIRHSSELSYCSTKKERMSGGRPGSSS